MQLDWTADFERERQRFALRFACEDCAHFDARRERCRHEWPHESHRLPLLPRPILLLCKEFELC